VPVLSAELLLFGAPGILALGVKHTETCWLNNEIAKLEPNQERILLLQSELVRDGGFFLAGVEDLCHSILLTRTPFSILCPKQFFELGSCGESRV
jgi:hypothetical protein